jgi:serine/threonine protein phosphatase PrpC
VVREVTVAAGEGTAGEATSAVVAAGPTMPAANREVSREWRIIGETVRGASHLRARTPNQDAILQVRESSIGLPLILSISDGHGSDKCFRSDRGSRFAVAVGSELVRETLIHEQRQSDDSQVESKSKEILPAEFARRWKAAVEADLEREPLTSEELDRLEAKDGVQARQLVESRPLLAYGATALTVGLTESFVIYLQLGDGEIITVSDTGEVSKPLPEDENLIANETTSLCTETAAQDFRLFFQPLPDPPPALILMTTDGYANSFTDDAGFLKVGSDILEMLQTDGFDAVNRSVRGWLEEATRIGSGDDCTLAIICRMDALDKSAAAAEAITASASLNAEPPTIGNDSEDGQTSGESE